MVPVIIAKRPPSFSMVHDIRRRGLAGHILNFIGRSARAAALTSHGITISGGVSRTIGFPELVAPVTSTASFFAHGIVLKLLDGSMVRIRGVDAADAKAFVEAATQAWREHLTTALAAAAGDLQRLSSLLDETIGATRFPAACMLHPQVEKIVVLFRVAPPAAIDAAGLSGGIPGLRLALEIHRQPSVVRERAAAAFVAAELTRMSAFFETIEQRPLTPEQRLAVVTDEDATLVLAGAGSGKTSVIVAKAAYLIERGIRAPDQILLLAFGTKAAAEMTERIKERSGAALTAKTFHALGYEIIRTVEGAAPALAPHASDEVQFIALLRDIIRRLVREIRALAQLIIQWFLDLFTPYRSQWDFQNLGEYYEYVEAHELRTLQGERVKSFEECEIANWLFQNGIAYEYEPVYPHQIPGNGRRAYQPDFRLTESGIYIEHFGVRRRRQDDGADYLYTAPGIDRDKYLADMEWKRDVHRSHGTLLTETFSYERDEGSLTAALAAKLAPHVTLAPVPEEAVLQRLETLGRFDAFTLTLATFLRHFKSGGLTIDQCRSRARQSDNPSRSTAFLDIFEHVFAAYQQRLGSRIDFEDMIDRAANYVRSGRYSSPFRHLLIDEFQDISAGRARLLQALLGQHADARIFAVGDDWQSIYRFAGADIHIMRNFGALFGGTFAEEHGVYRAVDLGRTFRSVDRIALPARDFVLRNPAQIGKEVIPAGQSAAAAIQVALYPWGQQDAALREALERLDRRTRGQDATERASVLLLGRYNRHKPRNLPDLVRSFPRLTLQFSTIHAAKGREADHVVLLHAETGRWGFPSEIADDPVLDLVLPEPEEFAHAEERRLFYVALTRARHSVCILAPGDSSSPFVRELIDDPRYAVSASGEGELTEHHCLKCGGPLKAVWSSVGRLRFECTHRFLCGNVLPACPVCNDDLPVPDPASPETKACSCGARFPACPACADGWLVERRGPYGAFLGCTNFPACNGKAAMPPQALSR